MIMSASGEARCRLTRFERLLRGEPLVLGVSEFAFEAELFLCSLWRG